MAKLVVWANRDPACSIYVRIVDFIRSLLDFPPAPNDTLKGNSNPQELKCHSRPNWELFGYLIKLTWIQISKVRTYDLVTFLAILFIFFSIRKPTPYSTLI